MNFIPPHPLGHLNSNSIVAPEVQLLTSRQTAPVEESRNRRIILHRQQVGRLISRIFEKNFIAVGDDCKTVIIDRPGGV
jgi:hypothetical protein